MKQTNDIDALLKLAFEAEGLLLMLKDRGKDMPAEALSLLAEKTVMLQAGVMELPYGAAPASTEIRVEDEASDSEAVAEAAEEETEADAGTVPSATPAIPAGSETLDERLARERARDIYKAFTLNDKFRYRRELFHGSESEFDDTLAIISAMSSFGEAEEYFYEDLCWDPDNDDVKAFMDTVKRHF